MTELSLPYPPSVNSYYRHVGRRVLISREGRVFRRRVCAILAAGRVRPLAGPLELEIDVHPPDRRRRDLDNVQKALLDALEKGGAYGDDSQIARMVIERKCPCPGGRVVVRLQEKAACPERNCSRRS